MNILLAVDGSEVSQRAVKHVIALSKELAKPPILTLVNVDPPLLQRVAVTMGAEGVKRYHAENAEAMTRDAKRALKRAGLQFSEELRVGGVADTILAVARKQRVGLIVMGSHGTGALRVMFLGSVSAKVVAQATVPVTIVQ